MTDFMEAAMRHALRVFSLLAPLGLAACGGGGNSEPEASGPTERLPLGAGQVAKLEAEPFINSMPGIFDPKSPCQNFIVPVRLLMLEGTLPAGIAFGAVSLRSGPDEVWRAQAAASEQYVHQGGLHGVARACANARTPVGRTVRVVAEVISGGGTKQVYADAVIGEAH
ncbi:hypothetical protein HLB44_15570 [Aquincola sp. S2]|uniref:Lipoprotein n=1 Tax=Pseudaquabacterium terrae TaxID=2732868 RepID=A0ABX2EII1_9BURK|nr:hypothetical protein [Aquabacterium terrae]NRF68413.1 hypothetical protein [Aquabacterium terrae]